MSTELFFFGLAVVAALWLRHEWHMWRYPERGCRTCGGSGKATDKDILGRKVIGQCRTCVGRGRPSTVPRRRSAR